ncbi:MAG: hypothetical protein KKD25_11490 [Gammaproteobacteria bacterium]|jgi:hypothetical protein|nr:hypothetical protein [Gammaproteobacteria bacterium]MBU0773495.1 hypothetical protein [Gammaproteobacteria bacterium]MBU0856705.1 hypothetical protein [Gammaproteobacteria bacterium]MBU1846765.1 hypothetical protein [Gammaproteobacteria bacterium]
MAIARIGSIALTSAVRNPPGHHPAQTALYEPVAAAAAAPDAAAALSGADAGVASRLSGLGALGRGLMAGELLAVRVLATAPEVALALEPAAIAGRPPAASTELPESMRTDQLALRHLHWRQPSPLDLATSMRAQVFQRISTALALRDATVVADPRTFGGERQGVTVDIAHLPTGAERWVFPLLLSGGQHAAISLFDEDDEERRAAHGAPASVVLLLDVDVSGLGRIRVRMYRLAGVALQFLADSDDAIAHIRRILPGLAATLAFSGTRLVSCQLLRAPAGTLRTKPLDTRDASTLHARLPLPLFRVAAEILLALTAPRSDGFALPGG